MDMSQIVGFAPLKKTDLSRHAQLRLMQRTLLREKTLRSLMDENRFVELTVDKPKRVVLVYSKADRYWFVVIENMVTKRIVTMLALWQYQESTLTTKSAEAIRARKLALRQIDPPLLPPVPAGKIKKPKVQRPLTSDFKPREVRTYDAAAPDPQVEQLLARYREEKGQRAVEAEAARTERNFFRNEHTVLAPWDSRFFERQVDFEQHYFARLKRYSGLTHWDKAPAFELGVTLSDESPELKWRLSKAFFREPLMSVIQTETFRIGVLKALHRNGQHLEDILELAVWVGPKRHALTVSERDSVIEGCNGMDKEALEATH